MELVCVCVKERLCVVCVRVCVCVCLMGMCVCSALYSYVDLENATHGIGRCVCERECVVCVRERECVCVCDSWARVCVVLSICTLIPKMPSMVVFQGGIWGSLLRGVPLPPCSLFGHHPKKETPPRGGFLSI